MLPPVTRTEMVLDTYFGVRVADPYRWLENRESDEVRAWLDSQARYASSALGALPHRDALRARIAVLRSGASALSGFRISGGAAFYLRQDPDADVPALVVRATPAASERDLLDPRNIVGAAHSAIDWYVPSPDGRYVACGVSQGGSERTTLHVIDVNSGGFLDDTIERVRFPFVSWLNEDGSFRSFIYHRYPEPPPETPPDERRLDSRSHLHRLGGDPDDDVVVLARDLNPRVAMTRQDRPFIAVSPGGAWLLAIVSHSALGGRTAEQLSDCTLYVAPGAGLADPVSCPWRLVAGVEDGVTAYALTEDALYLVIGRDAPRYAVVAVPLRDADPGHPTVIVPESGRVVEAVAVAGEHLLVRDLDAGMGRLRRVPLGGGVLEDIALPVDGTILEWAADPERPEVLLQLASWLAPPRVFRCDTGSGALEDIGWAPPSAVDFSDVDAHEIQVPARDGTPIPLSIVHPKGLRRDGEHPTLLTGYGSYGFSLGPEFRPEMLAWYERGGVYAVAHVRGGGEHGRGWHEAGRGLRKENTITDLIDCAQYLIAQGYTRPGRLAAEGASAGGITAGGALVRRPDLWAAMVLHVPVTDPLRAEFGENGPINVPEFGTVTTEDACTAC